MRLGEEPRAKQATLTALAPFKAKLVEKLKASDCMKSDYSTIVEQLLRLVNLDDEPILH